MLYRCMPFVCSIDACHHVVFVVVIVLSMRAYLSVAHFAGLVREGPFFVFDFWPEETKRLGPISA